MRILTVCHTITIQSEWQDTLNNVLEHLHLVMFYGHNLVQLEVMAVWTLEDAWDVAYFIKPIQRHDAGTQAAAVKEMAINDRIIHHRLMFVVQECTLRGLCVILYCTLLNGPTHIRMLIHITQHTSLLTIGIIQFPAPTLEHLPSHIFCESVSVCPSSLRTPPN